MWFWFAIQWWEYPSLLGHLSPIKQPILTLFLTALRTWGQPPIPLLESISSNTKGLWFIPQIPYIHSVSPSGGSWFWRQESMQINPDLIPLATKQHQTFNKRVFPLAPSIFVPLISVKIRITLLYITSRFQNFSTFRIPFWNFNKIVIFTPFLHLICLQMPIIQD